MKDNQQVISARIAQEVFDRFDFYCKNTNRKKGATLEDAIVSFLDERNVSHVIYHEVPSEKETPGETRPASFGEVVDMVSADVNLRDSTGFDKIMSSDDDVTIETHTVDEDDGFDDTEIDDDGFYVKKKTIVNATLDEIDEGGFYVQG